MLRVLAFALLLGGCSLDRTGLGVSDRPLDAGTMLDGGAIDPGAIDSGAIDAAALEDGGELDAGGDGGDDSGAPPPVDSGIDAPFDGGIDAGPPPQRTCDEIYSSAPGYILCGELDTSCDVFVDPVGNGTCDEICTASGGTCLGAIADGAGVCERGGAVTCADSMNDMICVCSRDL